MAEEVGGRAPHCMLSLRACNVFDVLHRGAQGGGATAAAQHQLAASSACQARLRRMGLSLPGRKSAASAPYRAQAPVLLAFGFPGGAVCLPLSSRAMMTSFKPSRCCTRPGAALTCCEAWQANQLARVVGLVLARSPLCHARSHAGLAQNSQSQRQPRQRLTRVAFRPGTPPGPALTSSKRRGRFSCSTRSAAAEPALEPSL